MDRKNTDCNFYFAGSCTKGAFCPFRHCKAALSTTAICQAWKEGLCVKTNCGSRHMDKNVNRSGIKCFWESQPGGCQKITCPFKHLLPRDNSFSWKASPKDVSIESKTEDADSKVSDAKTDEMKKLHRVLQEVDIFNWKVESPDSLKRKRMEKYQWRNPELVDKFSKKSKKISENTPPSSKVRNLVCRSDSTALFKKRKVF